MQIEIFMNDGVTKTGWFWHFRSKNGRITADAEQFPSKGNAMRAAKKVVSTICAQCCAMPKFAPTKFDHARQCYVITWS